MYCLIIYIYIYIYIYIHTHTHTHTYKYNIKVAIPVAALSEEWFCSRSLAGIMGSNPVVGTDICVF